MVVKLGSGYTARERKPIEGGNVKIRFLEVTSRISKVQVALLTGKVKPAASGGVVMGAHGNAAPSSKLSLADAPPFPADLKKSAPCAHPYYWAAFTLFGNTK